MKDDLAELLTTADALKVIGKKSRNFLYDQARRDPTFPRPVRVSAFSIAWRRSELMVWIAQLPTAELDGIDTITRRKLAASEKVAA